MQAGPLPTHYDGTNDLARSALEAFVVRLSKHSTLSERERCAILGLPAQVERARAHHDIVRQGEMIEHACLIGEGLVGKYGLGADGKRQFVSLHIPGEMIDLPTVVVPQAVTALTALSPATLLKVRHRDIRELSFEYPSIAVALWRTCVLDGAIVIQWVVNVGRRDARARLAHLLCEMSVRYRLATGTDGLTYDLPMTQEQLADALGLTAVHVNRTLRDLRVEGLVRVARNRIAIDDWAGLVATGQFEIDYLLSKPPPDFKSLK